ncbi:MAG: hypothetical protein PVF05_08390 [Gemmatimonadales bacterium]|jgi:hypothetical protein
MSRIRISQAGVFKVEGKTYCIPEHLSARQLSNYRTLLRPIPDIRGGTRLSTEQREASEAYFSRRAATGVIPGLDMDACASLSAREMRVIHRWIARHRDPSRDGQRVGS